MACHFSLVHLQLIASGNHRTVSSLVAAPLSTPHEQGPLSLRPSDVGTVFRHGEDIVLGANLLTHTPHKVCEDSEANCWSLASAFFYPSQGRELERPSPCPAFSAHLLGAFASPTSILERSLYQHMVDLSTSLSDLVHLGRARQYTNNIVPFQAELLSTYYLGI